MTSPRRSTPVESGDFSEHLSLRIKSLRQARHWSLDDLAGASGVSRSMLSQIERAQVNPTLSVAFRIARAFGLSLAELVETPAAGSSINVIRATDTTHHYHSNQDCRIRTLSPLDLEKDVEFYELQLPVGGSLRSAPHFAGTREFATTHAGRVRVESAQDAAELGPGDSASYRADVPHAIINQGTTEAIVYLLVIYQ